MADDSPILDVTGRVPEPVLNVLRRLEQHGHRAHLVGGCVRDLLRGAPVHDFDIATDARPERVMALFDKTLATGLKHGTVSVKAGDCWVEVTTYRVDIGYSDHRRPDAIRFTDRLEEDLARRDFTINAMALDMRGRLTDPFGGRADLAHGLIRTVGDPAERFREDGLRILRALRFVAQLGFDLEPRTLAAMQALAAVLRHVALERVGQEWLRIAQSDWERISRLLADGPWLDLWPHPLPGWRSAFTHGRPCPAWQRMRCLWRDPDERAALALCAWSVGAGQAARDVRRAGQLLAWPRTTVRLATQVAQAACAMSGRSADDQESWTRWFWANGRRPVEMASSLLDAIAGQRSLPLWRRARRAALRQPLWSLRDLALRGDELPKEIQGPEIGRVLNQLAEEVLMGRLPNERDALLAKAQRHAAKKG